jgi:hypothetical protein
MALDRYKARWVLRGFTQHPRVDYDETFSPVVKPATVRTVLTLAVSRGWPVHQLNVKNTFHHGTLSEIVYCSQPASFVDPAHHQLVCRLNKSLYGLKQAPRAWYHCFTSYLVPLGFMEAKSDTSLFVYRRGTDTAHLLLYVDDIVLTASSPELLQRTTTTLQQQFAMDLGPLHHFLGVSVEQRSDGLFLHQHQYARDIFECAGMSDCKPYSTSVDTQAKVSFDMGPPSATRLPTAAWLGLSSISPSPGPTLPTRSSKCASTCTTPVSPISRPRSASFGTSKAPSTTACFFTTPLHQTSSSTSAVYLSTNPVQHQRIKHVEIDLHFVRECVAVGDVRVLHVPTTSQFVDIFTEGLPYSVFLKFRSSLSICSG